MPIIDAIIQQITDLYEGGNWSGVSMRETLQDISYEEATDTTPASANSIAMLLFHTSYYNDIVQQRLLGLDPDIDEANGFDVPPILTEDDWLNLIEKAFISAQRLREAVQQLPETKLFETVANGKSSYYKTIAGVIEHTHYHLGQIVLLIKLIRHLKTDSL